MKKRKIYLDNLPLIEAEKIWVGILDDLEMLEPEIIDTTKALNRITAKPVFAKISSPHYHGAAMDGIAVAASKTFSANEKNPVRLKLNIDFKYVNTGDPLPPECDTVIMIEEVHPISDDKVEIISPHSPWEHVRGIGEDIVATELIVPENHRLRPQDLGAILAGGHAEISVRKRPEITILPTGTELVSSSVNLKPGDIIEYNSAMLAAYVEEWGGKARITRPAIDDYELIKSKLQEALETADAVIINAGSSAGTKDYTASVVKELGKLFVHGVAIRPGKPVVLGIVKGKPVIGIPGYPVSAALTMNLFIKPMLYKLQGIPKPSKPIINATISRQVVSTIGVEEFLRVKLGRVKGKMVASPLTRGAGIIMSLVRADGVVKIPALKEGLKSGEKIEVELLRNEEDIENTVVVIGSHDVTIDILANELKKTHSGLNLSSAHVGSMGGIMALKRKEAHIAGVHLLDPDTGNYNIPYIKRYLPGESIVLVNLVYREQGLIVPRGNPKEITGIGDLTRDDILFINRQKGAGTRLLLDLKLKELGINHEKVRGYNREEYTHMAIAATVAGGGADVGMGILAAANSLDLDFVPISSERYDLAIPEEYFKLDLVQKLLKVINKPEFQQKVVALGGYDISHTGETIFVK